MVVDFWPHGLSGTICFQRQSQDAFLSVAAEISLDFLSKWPGNASPFRWVPVMHQLVATGVEVKLWNLSPNTPSVFPSVHHHVLDWLGSVSAGFDCSGDMDILGEKLHVSVLEMKAVQLALNVFLHRTVGGALVLMSENASVVVYLKEQWRTVSLNM